MSNPTSSRASRILVVDDTVINVQLMSNILCTHGYEVLTAENGRIALEIIAAQSRLDLIMLDINMPEMNGYETCAQLKAAPRTRAIPIIFISTLDTAADKVKAFKAGAADYIPRPYQPEEVLLRVQNQLMLRSLQRQLKVANQKLGRANQELETSNRALSDSNEKLESTYQELAHVNQRLAQKNQTLTERNQEFFRAQTHLEQDNEKLERQIERRSSALNQLNEASTRWLSPVLLELLDKQKIIQIQAGIEVRKPLNLLFIHARGLDTQSSFSALNQWFSQVNPVVAEYAGFIEHYAGHSLVAIFPKQAEDAVQAALALINTSAEALDLHLSLHRSEALLGIIGDEHHLQTSLDADSLSLLQHLEAIGHHYGSPILCSSSLLNEIEQTQRYAQRYLGYVEAPEKPLDCMELLGEHPMEHPKLSSKELFEQAVRDYQQDHREAAVQQWQVLLQQHPKDEATTQYLQQAQHSPDAAPALLLCKPC